MKKLVYTCDNCGIDCSISRLDVGLVTLIPSDNSSFIFEFCNTTCYIMFKEKRARS